VLETVLVIVVVTELVTVEVEGIVTIEVTVVVWVMISPGIVEVTDMVWTSCAYEEVTKLNEIRTSADNRNIHTFFIPPLSSCRRLMPH
jgi:hypothetical protein